MGVYKAHDFLERARHRAQRDVMEMSKCLILKSFVNLNVLHPYSVIFSVPFSECLVLVRHVLSKCVRSGDQTDTKVWTYM